VQLRSSIYITKSSDESLGTDETICQDNAYLGTCVIITKLCVYKFILCVYNFSTLIRDLLIFFLNSILYEIQQSVETTSSLLNRQMLVRHAMAFSGILCIEAIC
jgi:hypothetical protein